MAIALRSRPGFPPALRRTSWRLWMIGRVPVYAATWLGFGLFVLFTLGGFVVAAMLGAGFAIGTAAGAILGSFGIPVEVAAARGGGVLVPILLVLYTGAALRRHRRDTAESSVSTVVATVRRVRLSLSDEWRDAAERWPSRRRSVSGALSIRHIARGPVAAATFAGAATAAFSSELPVGWRFWKVAPDTAAASSPVLRSVTVDSEWSGRRVAARCMRSGSHPHQRTPDLTCSCGIYALKEPLMPMYAAGGVWAAGRVGLSGRVLEGRRGYRAEQAEIVGILHVGVPCGYRRGRGPCAGKVTLAVAETGYQPACLAHRHLLDEGLVAIDAMQLQARLELRYGLEVVVDPTGGSWI